MRYRYVRVSSRTQNISRQMAAILDCKIERENIYIDMESEKTFNRKNYQKLIRKIKSNDEIFVKSIDRLGRNYDEIIRQWQIITKEKEAHIVVIDFPLLDTRNKVNGVTGKFIGDLVLQVMSYVVQVERENIHQRQMEGIREAKKRGVVFGRPRAEIPDNFLSVFQEWKKGQVSLRSGAKRLNTNHTTFLRWIRDYEKRRKC